ESDPVGPGFLPSRNRRARLSADTLGSISLRSSATPENAESTESFPAPGPSCPGATRCSQTRSDARREARRLPESGGPVAARENKARTPDYTGPVRSSHRSLPALTCSKDSLRFEEGTRSANSQASHNLPSAQLLFE